MDPVQSWLDAKEVRRMAESLMAPAPEVDQAAVEAGYGDEFEGFAKAAEAENKVGRSAPVGVSPVVSPSVPEPPVETAVQAGGGRREGTSHALADARRVAEGSGMLQSEKRLESTGGVSDLYDSPFQVSPDQSESEPVPLARQVSPAAGASVPTPKGTGVDQGSARGPFLARLQQFSSNLRQELDASAMFLIDNEGQVLLDEVDNVKLIQVARTLAHASFAASRQTAGAAAVGNLHVKIGASATLEVVPVQSRYGLLILGAIFPAPLGADRVRQVAELLSRAIEPSSAG